MTAAIVTVTGMTTVIMVVPIDAAAIVTPKLSRVATRLRRRSAQAKYRQNSDNRGNSQRQRSV